MIKLLLTLLMLFIFGTSTVNAEENTTNIEDRISELDETKTASQSTIKTNIDELSEYEIETIIANVDELTEPTEEDLAIKEAAISAILELAGVEEMESVETSNTLITGVFILGLGLMLYVLLLSCSRDKLFSY